MKREEISLVSTPWPTYIKIFLQFVIQLPKQLWSPIQHYLFVVVPKIINPLIKIAWACSGKTCWIAFVSSAVMTSQSRLALITLNHYSSLLMLVHMECFIIPTFDYSFPALFIRSSSSMKHGTSKWTTLPHACFWLWKSHLTHKLILFSFPLDKFKFQ